MINFIFPIIFLLNVLGCEKNNKSLKDNINFEDIFNEEEIIPIKDLSENIIEIEDLIVINDKIILLDKISNKITISNFLKNKTQDIGRSGRGPSEFLDPQVLIKGTDKTFFVVDGAGNFRVQKFDTDGNLLNTFPVGSFGPFTKSHFVEINNEKLLFITTVNNCENDPQNTCVIDVIDQSGNVKYNFAKTDMLEDEAIGLPYFSTIAKKLVYTAHVYGSKVYIFSLEGNLKGNFEIMDSKYVKLIDLSSLPSSSYEQLNRIREMSYTSILNLFSTNNYIFIEFLRNGIEYENKPKYFLNIYDLKGNLIFEGVESNKRLKHVSKDKFYFISKINDENLLSVYKLKK